jgi:hypothetical protein
VHLLRGGQSTIGPHIDPYRPFRAQGCTKRYGEPHCASGCLSP